MDIACSDVVNELARLKHSAISFDQPSVKATSEKISQWKTLFHYSHKQAVENIERRSTNLGRLTIANDVWEEIREAKEAFGFDKDAYEHLLETLSKRVGIQTNRPIHSSRGTATATYLLKLEGCLSDPSEVEALIQSVEPLKVEVDENSPETRFCRISAQQKDTLLTRLPFRPTLIPLSISSRKVFNPNSRYPTLGIEPTLPQYRLTCSTEDPLPYLDQYPVWYFFYGTLANPSTLSQRVGIPEEDLELYPASITGGIMSDWGGKYRTLLDGDINSATTVDGFGFLVESFEMEDTLRRYETDRYEVVRCKMALIEEAEEIAACKFRFLG